MNKKIVSAGVIHKIPTDLRKIIISELEVYEFWEDITPIARNEWICWIESAKKIETRNRRIRIMSDKLLAGERRPCCWSGCKHR